MNVLDRTPEWVHLLRACQRGAVQWAPTQAPGVSRWVLDGIRLMADDPRSAALDELAQRSLTHECDAQAITWAGAELLNEWSR